MAPSALDATTHVARAERHYRVGTALLEARDEWSAVCFFYAAYHYVKASLLSDPIFTDARRCARLNPRLSLQDRFTERHQTRKPRGGEGRGWGVNDLVLLLYRPIVGDYSRLHTASVSVRYYGGLPSGSLEPIQTSAAVVCEAFEAGELVAPKDGAAS